MKKKIITILVLLCCAIINTNAQWSVTQMSDQNNPYDIKYSNTFKSNNCIFSFNNWNNDNTTPNFKLSLLTDSIVYMEETNLTFGYQYIDAKLYNEDHQQIDRFMVDVYVDKTNGNIHSSTNSPNVWKLLYHLSNKDGYIRMNIPVKNERHSMDFIVFCNQKLKLGR